MNRRGVFYRGCIAADGDGSSLKDAGPESFLWLLVLAVVAFALCSCAGPREAGPITEVTREVAHKNLLQIVSPTRVRVIR